MFDLYQRFYLFNSILQCSYFRLHDTNNILK